MLNISEVTNCSKTTLVFGTFEAKKARAELFANSKLDEVEVYRRDLFFSLKSSYFKIYELEMLQSIVEKNIKILETFEDLAQNELENKSSTLVGILKIIKDKNALVNQLRTVKQNILAEKIAFNVLLNRDEEVVNKVDELNINEVYLKELVENNLKVGRLLNIKDALSKSELAVKIEGLPNIGIGLDYMLVDERNVENLVDNVKDIIVPMVNISNPLFSKKYSSKQKQLQLDQKAIHNSLENTKNNLVTQYEKTLKAMSNAKSTIEIQDLNIEEADNAKKVFLAAYETLKIDFEQLQEIQQLKLNFQLKKAFSEKGFATQAAKLEYLTN